LEESVTSAFRGMKVNHNPEDGSSMCLSLRKLHAAAYHKITVAPITTVVISNVIYSAHQKLLQYVRCTKNVKYTALQMRLVCS
jgi:hypothetical protein